MNGRAKNFCVSQINVPTKKLFFLILNLPIYKLPFGGCAFKGNKGTKINFTVLYYSYSNHLFEFEIL
jgi:hypothetical protein